MMKFLRRLLSGIIFPLLMLCVSSHEADAQQVAVKTNVLMWAGMTPNLGFEIVTGEHTSVDLGAFGHFKPYGINSKIVGLQPEFRYWFNGRPMIREFIGIGALMTIYDITWKNTVYDGDAVGLGITGGYVFSLGKRWNLELSGSFGFMYFYQKQYFSNDNYDDYFVDEAVRTNAQGYKMFPVDLGITFSYIIK